MRARDRKRPGQRYPPHPAPGSLRLIQDLLNTVEHRTGGDTLKDAAALSAWLSNRDLLPADTPLDPARVDRCETLGTPQLEVWQICDKNEIPHHEISPNSLQINTLPEWRNGIRSGLKIRRLRA